MNVKGWKEGGNFATVGLEIVLSVIVGFLAGQWLDRRFDTAPWLTVVGTGYGVATAARFVYRAWKKMQAINEREEREQGNPRPLEDPDEERREPSDKPRDRR